MKDNWDPKTSLTGNEYSDFLSWCEAVGIDFENEDEDNQEDDIDEQQESQEGIIKKLKGRDKYE